MPELHPSEEQPHDRDRRIRQRRSQVGLHQHQQHRHSDHRPCLQQIHEIHVLVFIVRKVLCHRQDQDEFHPLRWLEVRTAADANPAPGAQIFLPEHQHRDQRDQRQYVHPRHVLEQRLVVDAARRNHDEDTGNDPVDLPNMRTNELGVQRRRVDLDHPQRADRQHECHQHPIEVAK